MNQCHILLSMYLKSVEYKEKRGDENSKNLSSNETRMEKKESDRTKTLFLFPPLPSFLIREKNSRRKVLRPAV